jgi:cobalt/nickel transport system permease protein
MGHRANQTVGQPEPELQTMPWLYRVRGATQLNLPGLRPLTFGPWIMHIPDGVLSPEVCAGTGLLAAGAVGYSLHRLRQLPSDRTVPLTGMMAAVIFAGQMVNFPISLFGIPAVSGHLMGGVLASAVLGPWGGCVAIFLVLLVQGVLFADGGLLSLGANTLNMAVLGAWGGYGVLTFVRNRFADERRGVIVGVIVASWLSVLAAAAVFSGEVWLSWNVPGFDFGSLFTLMVTVHSAIGIGEALITGSIVSFLLLHRRDLVVKTHPLPGERTALAPVLLTGFVAALVVCAFLAPFASSHPDGLESVAERTSLDRRVAEPTALFLADYAVPLPFAGWENIPAWRMISVALSGILGTVAVVVMGFLMGRALPASPLPAGADHAR